ncbi:MAG: hypothetical protein V1722_05675 [Candidatus Micrarchaeota archaeon]
MALMRLYFAIVVLFLLLPLINSTSVASESSAGAFSTVSIYAKQYEDGQLNLLKFNVLLFNEREALFDKLNEKMVVVKISENEEHRGWNEETMRSIFGEPTGTEQWPWSPNLRTSIKLDKPVPRWEKVVYSGSKIKVKFNAFPNVIKREGEFISFYNFDFQVEFIKEIQVANMEQVVSEMRSLFTAGRNNEQKITEAANRAVQIERGVSDYLNNGGNCKETLSDLFGQTGSESTKLRWQAIAYNGDKVVVRLRGDEFQDTNWHGFNSWIEIERRMELTTPQTQTQFNFNFNSEEEYMSKIRETITELKRTASNLDFSPTSSNLAHLEELSQQYQQLVRELSEKANRRELDVEQDKVISDFEKLFSEQAEFQKENLRQLEFKNRLFNVSQSVSRPHCEGKETQCGDFQACVRAICTDARGGNEQCKNNVDDDGDTLVDCNDPDCFEEVSCGKKCMPICSGPGKCWECSGQECSSVCEQCSKCNDNNKNNPQACESICKPCGDCNNQKCSNKCESCWNCEDEYYGGGCRAQCKTCNACTESGRQDCGSECTTCNKCNYEKGNLKCNQQQVIDNQTYNCVCQTTMQCGECQHMNGETCSCVIDPQCTMREPERSEERQPNNETRQPQEEQRGNTTVNNAIPVNEPFIPQQSVNIEENKSKISTSRASPFSGLVTANGAAGACSMVCSTGQYCNAEKGWCECQEGFFDCDGDWQNGCESQKQCKECKQDSDCAPSRCTEDSQRVAAFACVRGDPFMEEVAGAEFGGNCAEYNSGKTENGVWLGAWGEGFEQFEQFKQQAQSRQDQKRCEGELQDAIKKRLELQSSLNDEFFNWLFNEVVSKDPDKFEEHVRTIWGVYDSFQRNSDDTARALRCLGRTDWPSEYVPVKAEVKTDFGKVTLWEEKKTTDFWGANQEIFSPYMKLWIFPQKEVFKHFFAEKIKTEGPKGPPPEELAKLRESPEAMAKIRKIAGAFGGDARVVVQAVDGNTPLAKFILVANEKDLIMIKDAQNYSGPVSATITVSIDFIYDVASSVAKDMEGERLDVPFWEQNKQPPRVVDEAVGAVKIFSRIFGGVINGDIKIEPISAVPSVLIALQELMSMITSQA